MSDDISDGTGLGDGPGVEEELLEEELRQAASLLDPVPPALLQSAVDAFALRDLEARVAGLTFDSLVDAIPVRGAAAAPRMLTFTAGEVTLDVELTEDGLIGQVLPPAPARIEVLTGSRPATTATADGMGRFTAPVTPSGPFALRLHTTDETVMTEWLRA
ncbi:hypothetical protein DD630_30250 [Streptomyces sp. BSE7F]|uniref:hypothetical protein n=1 Tax=Streptomyces sp. BSE7-9 TaxID=2759948 RepID=UPI000D61C876|nr:hypothetical protein [Streptomyces sp. BSE7-9]MBJ6642495.1 hypothetical protein [Streptomyces sp. BSE7-9]PWE10484.1 hypothetical protein DD630_30250 [Streptomyces sp. BSE7F]